MAESPVLYRSISSRDIAHHSDVEDGDGLYSIRIPVEARVKWTYFLLGCAILLPWNALINATSFFLSRISGSPLHPTFSSYLSSTYLWSKCVFQLYCQLTLKQSSPSRRILASISAMLILTISLFLSTFIRGTPLTFFAFPLFSAACMAAASAFLNTAVFAEASLLCSSFLQPVLAGQAAIGAVVSAVHVVGSIFALWVPSPKFTSIETMRADGEEGHPEEIAARIFFSVCASFLVIMLFVYRWLMRQSLIGRVPEEPRGDPDELTPLVAVAGGRGNSSALSNGHIYRVFRENFIFMFSAAYAYAVTLSVFPAITARVRSADLGIHPLLFTALHFLVFNVGDFVGRCSYSFPRLRVWSGRKLLAMTLLRTLFIPLVLLCNFDRPGEIHAATPIIHSDYLFMLVMLAMGFTTGYVVSLSLLAVSSLEHNHGLKGREDVDVAATLGGSCLCLGLAFGAISSFGVQAMIV